MNEILRNVIMGIIVLLLLLITVAIVMSFYKQDNLSQIIIQAAESKPQNQQIQQLPQNLQLPQLPQLQQLPQNLQLPQLPQLQQLPQNLQFQSPEVQIFNSPIPPVREPPFLPGSVAHDIMTEFDLRSAYDPLVEATRRPAKYITLPMINNPHFNYPTRGFTDSFSLMGYLISKEKGNYKVVSEEGIKQEKHHSHNLHNLHNSHDKDENKIVKLFGRQKYPNSTEYEYYVIINTGFNDNIKYSLEDQQKELFDSDSVFVDILQKTYKVKLLKNRIFEYNPYAV